MTDSAATAISSQRIQARPDRSRSHYRFPLARLDLMDRKLLIVLLILLVLLVALPVGMGMATGMCPNADLTTCPSAVGACAVVVALMLLVMVAALGKVDVRTQRATLLLIISPLDRPPRISAF